MQPNGQMVYDLNQGMPQGVYPVSTPIVVQTPIPVSVSTSMPTPIPIPVSDPSSVPGFASVSGPVQQTPVFELNPAFPVTSQELSVPQQPSSVPEQSQSSKSMQSFTKGTMDTLKSIGSSVGKAYGQFWVPVILLSYE